MAQGRAVGSLDRNGLAIEVEGRTREQQLGLRIEPDAGTGVRLDPKTQMLFAGSGFYINGERVPVEAADRPTLRRLADRRRLGAAEPRSASALDLLYDWYRHGFLLIGAHSR